MTEEPSHYYSHVRREIIESIPIGTGNILDIGCGTGVTGATLKREGRAKSVIGIEVMSDPGEEARKVLDRVYIGNIEYDSISFDFAQFDAVILADVLEHLVDPWEVLRRLRMYLKPSGLMVISLPNVRHWTVLTSLIFQGKWEYKSEGIMDKTHLRFFTRSEMLKIVSEVGLKIQRIDAVGARVQALEKYGLMMLAELASVQYLIVASN